MRPKIHLVLPFILVLFLLGAGCATEVEEPQIESGSGETVGEAEEAVAEVEEAVAAADEGGKIAKVGDTLTLKGTSYTVRSAAAKKKIGNDEFSEATADGKFVVVKLTLTNQKDEPAMILEDAIRLVGANGKEYTTDTDALFAFDNALLLAEEIQPDLSKKVVAVYDVPPKAVKGAKLQVKDLFSESKGLIDLGL